MRLKHLRDLRVETRLAAGHAFLSAASGLAVVDDLVFVIGDDEHHLAMFQKMDAAAGKLLRLLPGNLPRDAKLRKAQKPDFEILLALPAIIGRAGHRLLALGSGSTDRRNRGLELEINAMGQLHEARMLDLQRLYAEIALLVPEMNLEGAVVKDDELLLFNRGNMRNPETHILATKLSNLTTPNPLGPTLRKQLLLPSVDGVPLSVTDACLLGDGTILLSAVAEATEDSYTDGALVGSAAILLDERLEILTIQQFDPSLKVEGISGRRTAAGIEMLCVTDADDPDKPAGLYSALWRI